VNRQKFSEQQIASAVELLKKPTIRKAPGRSTSASSPSFLGWRDWYSELRTLGRTPVTERRELRRLELENARLRGRLSELSSARKHLV
jgi:hypothetical protein